MLKLRLWEWPLDHDQGYAKSLEAVGVRNGCRGEGLWIRVGGRGGDGPSCGLTVHQATIHHPRLWTSQVPATTNGECRLPLLGSWGGCPVLRLGIPGWVVGRK